MPKNKGKQPAKRYNKEKQDENKNKKRKKNVDVKKKKKDYIIQQILTNIKTFGFNVEKIKNNIQNPHITEEFLRLIINEIITFFNEHNLNYSNYIDLYQYISPEKLNIKGYMSTYNRIYQIFNDLQTSIKVNHDVDYFYINRYEDIKNILKNEEIILLKGYYYCGTYNFKEVKEYLSKNENINNEYLKSNDIIKILNYINQQLNLPNKQYETIGKRFTGYTTISTTMNIFNKKCEVQTYIKELIYLNHTLLNIYSRLLLFNITYFIENNELNNEVFYNLLNRDYHFNNLNLLLKYFNEEKNDNQILYKLYIPNSIKLPILRVNAKQFTMLNQIIKYEATLITTTFHNHLTITIPCYLKRLLHLKIDQYEVDNSIKIRKSLRNKIVNQLLNEFYNDNSNNEYQYNNNKMDDDEEDEEYECIIIYIKDHLKNIMNIDWNLFPLNHHQIENERQLQKQVLIFYYNLNLIFETNDKKLIKLIPLTKSTSRYLTLDKKNFKCVTWSLTRAS